MRRFQNQKGLTLVELLAGLAIGGIVISLVMSLFIFMFQFYQDQEQEIVDRSQNHILNTILSRNLSSPIVVYYWSENELRFKNQNDTMYSLLLDQNTKQLIVSKCTSCVRINNFTSQTTVEQIQNVEAFTVSGKSPSQTIPLKEQNKLLITLEDPHIKTSGEKVVNEKEISWSFTPLNKKYNKPPN